MSFIKSSIIAAAILFNFSSAGWAADDDSVIREAQILTKEPQTIKSVDALGEAVGGANRANSSQSIHNDVESIHAQSSEVLNHPEDHVNRIDVDKMRNREISNDEKRAIDLITERGQDIERKSKVLPNASSPEKGKGSKAPEARIYAFVSLSMPEGQLKSLFNESLNYPHGEVIFVFRGWHPPDMDGFQQKIHTLLPSMKQQSEMPTVNVDPYMYRQYSIEQTPVFYVKTNLGYIKAVGGETLANVEERVKTKHNLVFGNTYGIDEPDLIAYMEKRAKEIDWQAEMARAEKNMYRARYSNTLPQAIVDSVQDIDLTIRVKDQIKDTEGHVIAEAGQSINPLDYLSTTKKYVFFDAQSPVQFDAVDYWQASSSAITLIAGNLPEVESERVKLEKRFHQHIYALDTRLTTRFKLTHFPCVAYQKGRMMRVETKGIKG